MDMFILYSYHTRWDFAHLELHIVYGIIERDTRMSMIRKCGGNRLFPCYVRLLKHAIIKAFKFEHELCEWYGVRTIFTELSASKKRKLLKVLPHFTIKFIIPRNVPTSYSRIPVSFFFRFQEQSTLIFISLCKVVFNTKGLYLIRRLAFQGPEATHLS